MQNKSKAITLIEIIISITIIGVLMIMLFGAIAKKAKALAEVTSGTFYCWKDSNDILHQRAELSDGTIQEKQGIGKCNFTFPKDADHYNITIIGGGGGGGLPDWGSCYEISNKQQTFQIVTPSFGLYKPYPYLIKNSIAQNATNNDVYTEGDCVNWQNHLAKDETAKKIISNSLTTSIMEDSAYNTFILQNHPLIVKGGNGMNKNGAMCAVITNFSVGDQVLYYDGRDEKTCLSDSIDNFVMSSSPGALTYNGVDLVRAEGQSDILASGNKYSTLVPNCVYEGGNNDRGNRKSNVDRVEDKVEYTLVTRVFAKYGTGGKAGNIKEVSSINLAGRTIEIEADHVGSGGEANKAGGATWFKDINLSVQGGSAGINTTQEVLEVGVTPIKNDELENTSSRIKYFQYDSPDGDGEISNYVKDVVFNSIIPDQQVLYKGQKGTCSQELSGKNKCKDAKAPHEKSFGSGGGGATSMIEYDNFSKFQYTRYDYRLNEYEVFEIPFRAPVCHRSFDAGKGSGGAIIIKW